MSASAATPVAFQNSFKGCKIYWAIIQFCRRKAWSRQRYNETALNPGVA
jgi:hypothetical protein